MMIKHDINLKNRSFMLFTTVSQTAFYIMLKSRRNIFLTLTIRVTRTTRHFQQTL